MLRLRAGSILVGLSWLPLTVGCGARTGLLADSEAQAGTTASSGGSHSAGTSSAGASSGGTNSAGANSAGTNSAGTSSAGAPSPPVRTNCQLQGDDPRVAGIKPDEIATLNGADFVIGDVKSYHWTLQLEDCDAVVQDAQFKLRGADSPVVQFQPSRPGLYHFTLAVTGAGGDQTSCKLAVPVAGVGMRVELCWDTSTTTDLDLYLHTPFDREPWFTPGAETINSGLNATTCNTSNATVALRNQPRVDWGYADSPLSACNTPSFDGFLGLARCPNPRAADDNNQDIATGTTERMQLDNPRAGQAFRVMVQNFDNHPARPRVFVYCDGQRAGAFDPPTLPANFVTEERDRGVYGVMWRVADVATIVDAAGKLSCITTPVLERTVTIDDSRF